MTYRLVVSHAAGHAVVEVLPEPAAIAAAEFITGPLLQNPHRVGKALLPPRAGQHGARRGEYRIVYTIDDDARTVTVLAIAHRRGAYRS